MTLDKANLPSSSGDVVGDLVGDLGGEMVNEARMLAALSARANAARRANGNVQLSIHLAERPTHTVSRQVHRLIASS